MRARFIGCMASTGAPFSTERPAACQAGSGHPHIPTRDHPMDPGDLTPKPASPDLPLAPAGAALRTFPGFAPRTRT